MTPRRLIPLILCLLLSHLAAAQTDLYKRYASRTDIRVASVTNFTLDTGITADVTLLEAIDDQGWAWLCSEFNLAPLTPQQQQQMDQGWDVAMFTQRNRHDPTQPAPVVDEQIDQAQSCYVGVSYLTRTLYVFCCSTDRQSDVVVNYLIEKMRRSLKTKE